MNNIAKVQTLLKIKRLGAAYLTSPENVRYATGCAIPGARALVLPDLTYLFCEDTADIYNDSSIVRYREDAFTIREIRRILKENTVIAIGVEDRHTSYFCYNLESESLFCGICCAPLSEALAEIRACKESWEQDILKRAQLINHDVFSILPQYIAVGMSEWDIAREIDCLLRKSGADGISFPTVALIGENTLYSHMSPSKSRILQNGDVVLVDYGCKLDGYCSDFARTFAAGKPPQTFEMVYKKAAKTFKTAVGMMFPGISSGEIDFAIRGIPGYFSSGFSLGHGIGLEVHEAPFLGGRSTDLLRSGNVLALEPDFMQENEWRIRIEDLVFISETGAGYLCTIPNDAPVFPVR